MKTNARLRVYLHFNKNKLSKKKSNRTCDMGNMDLSVWDDEPLSGPSMKMVHPEEFCAW